jgi:hypothetical protein
MSLETEMENTDAIEGENLSRKPSTWFLVILNALIFLCLLLPGLNPIGWILAIPVTLVFVALSGVWHGAWIFLNRKFHLHSIIRCVGFVLPVLGLLALPYFGIEPDRPINKQKPAISDAGQFSAYVTAESGGWNVEILDSDGLSLLNEETEFVPHLNVYWIWGPENRLWLYNSDDGRVHCWHDTGDDWIRTEWGYGKTRETKKDLGMPPPELYPDYAR